MPQDLTRTTKLTVVSIVVIAAILMIAVLPFVVPDMLDGIQQNQKIRTDKFYADGNPQAPLIETTMAMVGWTYPLVTLLSMFAGVILLIIVKPFYNGEKWAKGLTLLCLAFPTIAGAYMMVPYFNFMGVGWSPAFFYMIVGLVGYFSVVLAIKTDIKQKIIEFWVFLLLGVTAAESWANGTACHRILEGHPKMPFYADGIFILFLTRGINWLSVIFLLAAIYLLAMRKPAGWYAALIGAVNAGLLGFVTQTVRTATYDYLYQGLMGLVILITLLIPVVKARLLDKNENVEINNTSIGA